MPRGRTTCSSREVRSPLGGCTDGVRVGAIETGDMIASLDANSARLIAGAALAGVVGSLALAAGGHHQAANWLWAATTAMLLVPLTWSVLRSLLRGDDGVDAIASCRWRERSLFANTWPARSWR
jgi:hypothetical protein